MCPLRLAGLAAPPPRRGTPSGTPSGTPLWSGAHLASAGPRSSAGAPVPAPCRLGVPRPSGRLRNALPSGVAHTHCPGEDGSPSPTITELLERPHGVSHIRSAVELSVQLLFPPFPLGACWPSSALSKVRGSLCSRTGLSPSLFLRGGICHLPHPLLLNWVAQLCSAPVVKLQPFVTLKHRKNYFIL